VFDHFRRVGPQEVAGEGMGLAYTKMLVKRHDGRIWCESEPGVGTVFSVAIPTALAMKVTA
jgi:signal transduction histidine kinase